MSQFQFQSVRHGLADLSGAVVIKLELGALLSGCDCF